MQKDFKVTSSNNVWFGYFTSFSRAGFITACSCRFHGESDLVPGSLNLALQVEENQNKVLRNRRKFAAAIGVKPDRFTTCAQVHGNNVQVVTEDLIGRGAVSFADTIPETDALITNLADVPLLLFYADCVPVLLADPVTGAIGLAHAGWRGTAAQIAKKTVRAMIEAFGVNPDNLLAAKVLPSAPAAMKWTMWFGTGCRAMKPVLLENAMGNTYLICGRLTGSSYWKRGLFLPTFQQRVSVPTIIRNCFSPTGMKTGKQDAWVCACAEKGKDRQGIGKYST